MAIASSQYIFGIFTMETVFCGEILVYYKSILKIKLIGNLFRVKHRVCFHFEPIFKEIDRQLKRLSVPVLDQRSSSGTRL